MCFAWLHVGTPVMVNVPTRLSGYFISETTEWISLQFASETFHGCVLLGFFRG
jgi:hypothetical protein